MAIIFSTASSTQGALPIKSSAANGSVSSVSDAGGTSFDKTLNSLDAGKTMFKDVSSLAYANYVQFSGIVTFLSTK